MEQEAAQRGAVIDEPRRTTRRARGGQQISPEELPSRAGPTPAAPLARLITRVRRVAPWARSGHDGQKSGAGSRGAPGHARCRADAGAQRGGHPAHQRCCTTWPRGWTASSSSTMARPTGPTAYLEELARGGRVRWTRDDGPYRQAEITTALAREAARGGADWVLPIDADEFWYAPGGGLRRAPGRVAGRRARVQVSVNFVQRRDRLERDLADALLQMTPTGHPRPIGSSGPGRRAVRGRRGQIAISSRGCTRRSGSAGHHGRDS